MEHGMRRDIRTYSESFRRQVVAEYEAGSSLAELKRKYGIGGQATIPKWIAKYGSAGLRHKLVRIQTAEEATRVKVLEQQVEQLERALAKMTLEKLKLESVLEVLQEQQGADVTKKNAR
jgi:transposase-like protein